MSNTNLKKALILKNDEFYTLYQDIEKELVHYEKYFENKIVYSNCDSPDSNFVKYFKENKERLKIKEFYYTWYDEKTGKGSFESEESIELLKKCDIVVSNPPFSLFRKYLFLLEKYNKKYLILGNLNAVSYRSVFPLIKENKLWLGVNSGVPMEFIIPNSSKVYNRIDENGKKYAKVPSISWFTNLKVNKENKLLLLTKNYKGNEVNYPYYDNYDAIEVSKIKDIPIDYDGVMGVPITFLTKYCDTQFEIVGLGVGKDLFKPNKKYLNTKIVTLKGEINNVSNINYTLCIEKSEKPINKNYYISDNSKYLIQPYTRILIKHKK
jgi:hypothetical protein